MVQMPERLVQEQGIDRFPLVKTGLVVLTLNPGPEWIRWLEALKKQTFYPERVLVIDSGSTDGSLDATRQAGLQLKLIRKEDFGHGKTRQFAVELLNDVEFIVFMTQDAVLANFDSLEKLIQGLMPSDVGAAFGRQLPRIGANPIEAHARLFNYPERSRVKSMEDVAELGIKTPFISNSFAAYKRKALMEVGGFPADLNFGEDVFVASRLLLKGWKISYVAESKVYHSHDLSLLEEFRRYIQVGKFYGKEQWITDEFGRTGGEGKRFLISEWKHLVLNRLTLIPLALLRSWLKFLGYNWGRFWVGFRV